MTKHSKNPAWQGLGEILRSFDFRVTCWPAVACGWATSRKHRDRLVNWTKTRP